MSYQKSICSKKVTALKVTKVIALVITEVEHSVISTLLFKKAIYLKHILNST